SENSFLQFDCDCSAVLSEKSGLANRFCEGIDARLLICNLRTEDTTGDLCDFRKTMHRRATEWISLHQRSAANDDRTIRGQEPRRICLNSVMGRQLEPGPA